MRILYFKCSSGISGDMTVSALLDLLGNKTFLVKELEKLKIKDYKIKIKKINKKGVPALSFSVEAKDQEKERNLKDIYKIIDQSFLNKKVKELSKKIFLNLARAESKVHKTTFEKVHFHEVGAIDSIIDIVATAILIKKLGLERIYSSRLSLGRETAPATKELLKDVPINVLNIDRELVTPTGAAIIKTIADEFLDNVDIKIEKKGYGAGKINLKIPNVLEVILGEVEESKEKLVILETNIDDMNPQFYNYIIEKLIKNGGRDAYIQPIIMKKNRIGTLLTVICNEKVKNKLIEEIFDETTTFGIRINKVSRVKLDREIKEVKTKYGIIHVKVGKFKGKVKSISPEYEDCKKVAAGKNIPIKRVYGEAKKLVDNF